MSPDTLAPSAAPASAMSDEAPDLLAWNDVCSLDQILPDSGVATRLEHHRIAVFRLADGQVFAVDHIDPFTGVPVMARGLVGEHNGTVTVASPLHKQRFSLGDGRCLDDDSVLIATYPARVVTGRVQVAI